MSDFTTILIPLVSSALNIILRQLARNAKLGESNSQLWATIRKKFDTKTSAKEALDDLLKNPQDADTQKVFNTQLRKLIEEDSAFAGELSKLLQPVPQNVIESDLSEEQLYISRAKEYWVKGDYKNAIVAYSNAIEINPNSATLRARRAHVYFVTGNYEYSLADYDKAILIDHSNANFYGSRSGVFHAIGKFEEALADISKAIEINPSSAGFYSDRGSIYYALSRFDDALSDFTRALELNPADPNFYTYLGTVNSTLEKNEEAISDFRKAIELDKKNANPWIGIGNVYFKSGDQVKAAEAYRKALEIDPSSNQAQDGLRSIESGQPYTSSSFGGNNQPPLPPSADTLTEQPEFQEPNSNLTPSATIKSYSIIDDALDKHVATDKPVQSVKQDKLDFKIYVNGLHNFILSKYTTTPITISIDGPWGTGKSSLMSMLKGKLDPQRNGVRKLYEWFAGLRPWWRWYFRFLKSSIAKWFGKTIISLFVRNDVDEDGIYLYFGQNNKRFHKYISDIVEGFSIDPEVLNQTGNEKMEERIRKWAMVHANCEPMQPLYHYAVWLNAWKFDNQEEVWASLALATMEQIKQKHGLLWRLRFWLELTFSRFSFLSGLWQVVKQFLLPLIFAIVLASYNTIIESATVPLDAFKNYGNPLLWAGFVISGILAVSSIFKDPFQIPLDKVFDRPNYKDKVKFLSHFEKDFARIVRAATKNGFGWKPSKLVIFIDDLDRCEPPKSADIVEAVNLFLDAEGCVFVIGMDSESVSKSVEVKYKDLFERMKAENTGVVSLGRSFLDKIVQIPFSVPRATPSQITRMVEDAIGVGSQPISLPKLPTDTSTTSIEHGEATPSVSTKQVREGVFGTGGVAFTMTAPDVASYAKPEVQAAILAGTKLLSDNPRQVKTFINLFRLSIYIANERGLLEEKITAEKTSGLNLEKLAMWIACSVRWQSLVRHFHTDAQIDSLRVFLYTVSQTILSGYSWQESAKIPEAIKADYKHLREDEKGSDAHWCYLPWEWWLLEPDFLKTIKSLQDLWHPKSTDEIDWLEVLLTMTRPIN